MIRDAAEATRVLCRLRRGKSGCVRRQRQWKGRMRDRHFVGSEMSNVQYSTFAVPHLIGRAESPVVYLSTGPTEHIIIGTVYMPPVGKS